MKLILTEQQEKDLIKALVESEEIEMYAPHIGRKIGYFFSKKEKRHHAGFRWAQYFRNELREMLK